jgi:transcriptional regulator with XRE-family HTH domain
MKPVIAEPASAIDPREIGERLRSVRTERNLTIQELATKAGLSVGNISQIERGISNPSIKTLQRLRAALGVNLWEFLDRGETRAVGEPPFVRRKFERPTIIMSRNGLTKELLSPQADQGLRFMLIKMPPASESTDVLIGRGLKGGYVMRGRVLLRVGDNLADLEEGDSFQFASDVPHQVSNRSDSEATLLWIMSVLDTHI